MRVLYIKYTTWKTIAQDNSFTIYETSKGTEQVAVWCGSRDVVYSSDVTPDEWSDYESSFPSGPGRVAVDGEDEAIAHILNLKVDLDPRSSDGALVVATQHLRLGQARFLRVDDGTALMNVNGIPAGSVTVLWNGTGGSDNGGDWTASGDGSESSEAAKSGTNGWDSGSVNPNSETSFDNGTPIDVVGSYDTLSFWIQPKSYPNRSEVRLQWKNGSGADVGTSLNVEDYVTNMDLNVWQKVQVPISDFNLTENVQSLRIEYKKKYQRHWFDNFEFQAADGGGPHIYQVAAPAGVRYHLSMLVLIVVAADTGWNGDAFTTISGGLPNGLIVRQRRLSDGEVLWSLNSKDNIDLFGRYHPQESFNFADSTQLVGLMLKPGTKASVLVTDDEVLEFVVRDNLSSLDGLRAFAHYGEEKVSG